MTCSLIKPRIENAVLWLRRGKARLKDWKLDMSGKGAKGLITAKDKDKKKPISRSSRAGLQVPLSLSLSFKVSSFCVSRLSNGHKFSPFSIFLVFDPHMYHIYLVSLCIRDRFFFFFIGKGQLGFLGNFLSLWFEFC